MIEALDHIALSATPLDAAMRGYETLLGRRAEQRAIRLANVRLELHDTAGAAGLSMLAFAVRDLAKAQNLLVRRGLPVTQGSHGLHIAPQATHGVPITLTAHRPDVLPEPSPPAGAEPDAAVASLDHVVIRSPNPERAIALYAGRLGLSLRLDRSEPAWGARLMFFRCGDLVVEVAHDLKAGVGDGPDRLWGLSWRVPDTLKAHARLSAAGVDVSDVRVGRRPHTKVFTVRSHTAGVPTLMLMLGPDPKQIVLRSHPLADG
jgi:catechol 2,3-dioxygenase-like lactoylglutathione lyase family enzyme